MCASFFSLDSHKKVGSKLKGEARAVRRVASLHFVLRARAALIELGVLRVEADFMRDLDERGHGGLVGQLAVFVEVSGRRELNGGSHVVKLVAAAALRLGAAGGCGAGVADEVALGLGAGSRLAAGPRAFRSRAGRSAVWNGGSADGLAFCRQAHVLTERATTSLAVFP
jgi:hypothetical protein